MPEPTDHRAEAHRWLGFARDREAENLPADEVHSAALIGIGHALLAGPQPTIVLRAPEHLDAETIERARADFLKHYQPTDGSA